MPNVGLVIFGVVGDLVWSISWNAEGECGFGREGEATLLAMRYTHHQ